MLCGGEALYERSLCRPDQLMATSKIGYRIPKDGQTSGHRTISQKCIDVCYSQCFNVSDIKMSDLTGRISVRAPTMDSLSSRQARRERGPLVTYSGYDVLNT